MLFLITNPLNERQCFRKRNNGIPRKLIVVSALYLLILSTFTVHDTHASNCV